MLVMRHWAAGLVSHGRCKAGMYLLIRQSMMPMHQKLGLAVLVKTIGRHGRLVGASQKPKNRWGWGVEREKGAHQRERKVKK